MAGEITFFELGVDDVERGRTFYGGLFGWSFEPGPAGGLMIRGAGAPGGAHGGDPGASPYVFFSVDDLDAALDRVRELGGTVEGNPDGSEDSASTYGRFRLCRDDQGSPFGLHQPPAAASA